MKKIKLYTHEEMLDRIVGKKGSPRRDAMDAELHSHLIRKAAKGSTRETRDGAIIT